MNQQIINGNNIEILKDYPDNYFDSIVTDPPYGLGKEPNAEDLMKDWIEKGYHEIKGSGFMGKEWDAFVPQPIFWKEVFRVLKPGGHVLAFYGTRTYDWGVMAMRFAGFEVRDCIQWLYGSGFPKSHNIGKAIDKIEGNERELVQNNPNKRINKADLCIDPLNSLKKDFDITKGNSDWEGWGTALKPANEPIVLARKPLEKGLSVAENILKWGVGGINIDASRIEGIKRSPEFKNPNSKGQFNNVEQQIDWDNTQGRFPANIILDEEAAEILDEQSGVSKSSNAKRTRNTVGSFGMPNDTTPEYSDKGGASRFFYVAKASKAERNKGLDVFETKQTTGGGGTYNEEAGAKYGSIKAEGKNFHPTVKPIKLMQYLVKMITPPNGIVLDPFCGSGTTGVACKLDGFQFIGLEQDPEYSKIAEARINNCKIEPKQIDIF